MEDSKDLISRRKAFEYFVALWECIGTIMDRDEWEDVCMTTANEIPSAQLEHNPDDERKIADLHKIVNYLLSQQEQRWIPVTERLPEDEYVFISKKPSKISGSKWSVAIAIRTADPRSRKIQWRDSGFGVIQDDEVLAWMQLPEPYRGEENENR